MQSFWPYLIIVGTLFFTGIGLPPLPEELPILAAGVTASNADLSWFLAWPACIVGVLAADLALYGAGRLGGKKLLGYRWVRSILSPERYQRLEAGFHRHGLGILLTGRLLPGLRTGVFLTAGVVRYPFWRFLSADALYAVPGVALVFFGSYFLAETFSHWFAEVDRVRHWIVILVLVAAAAYGIYRFYRVRFARPAAEDVVADGERVLVGAGAAHSAPMLTQAGMRLRTAGATKQPNP